MNKITNSKILSFVRTYPDKWHEGLEEKEAIKVKKWVEGKFGKKLWRKFYWKKADSYIFQDLIDDHVYCISKKYFDNLDHE